MASIGPRRRAARAFALSAGFSIGLQAFAAAPDGAPGPAAVTRSSLDAPLFYQLLIGEMELRAGHAGNAYEVMLDAARRTKDEQLFRRAVEIALQARAGEQALNASRAWRSARPDSIDALRMQLQILALLNRSSEIGEPLSALLAAAPDAERVNLLGALPRLVERAADKRAVAALIEAQLRPYAAQGPQSSQARLALGRIWLAAGDADKALAMAQRAAAGEPDAPGPALLALELMTTRPAAEQIVAAHLARPGATTAVRLSYVRALTGAQRYTDAIAQLQTVTRAEPELAPPWLTLGALQLELKQSAVAEASLQRYLELAQRRPAAPAAAAAEDDDDDAPAARGVQGPTQAWLMLAQSAEQRGDYAAAERWLANIDSPQLALQVQSRKASLLARQGRVDAARELIRKVPERQPDDARAKLLAEAQMLRDLRQWGEAHAVLDAANARFADDADLLYEQAMMAEKMERLDAMERLLRRVIAIKPEHSHAHNALGYSLADRNLRLDEAKQLIQRALELSPGDPFITDSLGWVEFRLGNREQAIRLLRNAYAARPDTEIAAHLGEVLWAAGEQDEAKRVWREARVRDADNEVLRETLRRLKVDP